MKFGVRQIANVVFRAADNMTVGSKTFRKGQPVFYLDTAKTSSMEGGATSVYATGGRGNTRLLAWEGEKTLTFTVEDALLSPISFSMLSGAGILQGDYVANRGQSQVVTEKMTGVHVHQTTRAQMEVEQGSINDGNGGTTTGYIATIDLTGIVKQTELLCETAPIYVMELDSHGDITGDLIGNSDWKVKRTPAIVTDGNVQNYSLKLELTRTTEIKNANVLIDYYLVKDESKVTEIQIDAQNFGGYFYVEADTLFRRQGDGTDLPAILTFPNVKIQSNFTFSMAASGDPSTFTFTMDAFPAYTYFNTKKKVLCAIQIIDEDVKKSAAQESVFKHPTGGNIDVSYNDSSTSGKGKTHYNEETDNQPPNYQG